MVGVLLPEERKGPRTDLEPITGSERAPGYRLAIDVAQSSGVAEEDVLITVVVEDVGMALRQTREKDVGVRSRTDGRELAQKRKLSGGRNLAWIDLGTSAYRDDQPRVPATLRVMGGGNDRVLLGSVG